MIRQIQLTSGLVLFAFSATHLANHALGVVSLAALEYGQEWFLRLWRTRPGGLVLYTALLAHFLLALWSVYQRRTFRLKSTEWVQLLFGLSIPVLLVGHALSTRLAFELYDRNTSYTMQLAVFFVLQPGLIYKQMLLLLVVWIHGCIGVHRWLRLKPGYRRYQWVAFAIGLLLPSAALAGVWVAGRDIHVLAAQPGWLDQLRGLATEVTQTDGGYPSYDAYQPTITMGDQVDFLDRTESWILYVASALLAVSVLLRPVRRMVRLRRGLVRITYPDGNRVTVSMGTTILEASRLHQIPHASVCGGRGRCSTCRVRVVNSLEVMPGPGISEIKLLQRISASDDIRLACQAKPNRDCTVTPLLDPGTSVNTVGEESEHLVGQEREIFVLFADLRDFTTLSEQKLPYDLVFLLNRYFAAMGSAISVSGGYVDKFVGDGVMALFGLDSSSVDASQAAIRSAYKMADELAILNQLFKNDLSEPLRMGIGIHGGPAIVGTMGYGESSGLTAIGDTVNTASRLEGMTKTLGVQLIFSEAVAESAEIPEQLFKSQDIEIRGRTDRLSAFLVPEISELEKLAWIRR